MKSCVKGGRIFSLLLIICNNLNMKLGVTKVNSNILHNKLYLKQKLSDVYIQHVEFLAMPDINIFLREFLF